jgi:hypothetical protein
MHKKIVIHIRHLAQLGFEAVEPQIQLFGGFDIKRPSLVTDAVRIFNQNQIRLRTVLRRRIAP